jgi:uncharacterized protein (DUF58 family)
VNSAASGTGAAVTSAASAAGAGTAAKLATPRVERRSWRSRVRAWISGRVPPADTLELTHRNVYILPTRAGLLFAATLVVLLIASINYQLNLGYVLTFLLAGSGAVSMHVTHRTLRGLTVHLKPLQPTHAQQAVPIGAVLTNPDRARHGVGLRLDTHDTAGTVWVDVPATNQATAALAYEPPSRGWQALPPVIVETRFPLGLFRAWAVWRPASKLMVYPKPESPMAPLPEAQPTPGGASTARALAEGNELQGVRPYRRGDALNRVVWRKAAKTFDSGGELVTRDLATPARWQLWLDWQACSPLASEERLSRLTAWVLACEREGADYGLKLPRQELAQAHGDGQRRTCLQALATWSA